VSTSLERLGFLAAFTERTGGVSPKPWDSMNLAFFTGDDPANVRANRARGIEALGVPPFAVVEHVHGTKVVRVGPKRGGAGFATEETCIRGADGAFTSSVGVALSVLGGDCLNVVMASPRQRAVAVIHAGWRGLAAGMMEAAIAPFDAPSDVRVAIGPAIGPCHYEVGHGVALAVAAASEAGAVTDRRDGRLFLDLAGTATAHLRALGVTKIEATGLCTACERRRFFSHRRDGFPSGRQGAVAMRG